MSASTTKNFRSSTTEQNVNKCALKLIDLEFGVLTDEDILEHVSVYVHPTAIKALLYDSFNDYYVLHLSDIDSTCLLIGKTLQFGAHHVTFLPLLDSFVIGNVYPGLSSNLLCDIFGVFGKVFEVSEQHVLPNSSKFFHVLSGRREISFLLPGRDSEVQVPENVIHRPYFFHMSRLCAGCLAQGHSLMNCPDKDVEVALPKVAKAFSTEKMDAVGETHVKEMSFEVEGDKHIENKVDQTIVKTEIKENENLEQSGLGESYLVLETLRKQKARGSKNSKSLKRNLNTDTSILAPVLETLRKQKACGSKNSKSLKRNLNTDTSILALERKKRHSSTKLYEEDSSTDMPRSLLSCIQKTNGVIPKEGLIELLNMTTYSKQKTLAFILSFNSDITVVLYQLRTLQTEWEQKKDSSDEKYVKFTQRLSNISKILKCVL